jgi:hypothetical protein
METPPVTDSGSPISHGDMAKMTRAWNDYVQKRGFNEHGYDPVWAMRVYRAFVAGWRARG